MNIMQRFEPHEMHQQSPLAARRETSGDAPQHVLRGPTRAVRLARGLGWFSIALGLTELLAPRAIAKIAGGGERHTGLIQLYGLREIAAGLLIFSQGRKPVAGVWSRVGGDAMDLMTLGAVALSPNANKPRVAFAAASVLALTALDMMCAKELRRESGTLTDDGAIRASKSITINRSPAQVYQFWQNLENFPRFMFHVRSVVDIGEGRTHWVARGPHGRDIEWDSEITDDRPDELIAWHSLEGGDLNNSGSVRFEPKPGGRGTIVRVVFEYFPPGGIATAAWAKLAGASPEGRIDDDLRRFKQIIETGEVVRSDGSPDGTGQISQRPAQPSDDV